MHGLTFFGIMPDLSFRNYAWSNFFPEIMPANHSGVMPPATFNSEIMTVFSISFRIYP